MKTCFFILVSLLGMTAYAQPTIGVKSGLSISDLHGSNERNKEYNWREALYGGLYMSFKINRFFYLQPEINYSPQGGQRNGMQELPMHYVDGIELPAGTKVYASFDNTTILNYLELPVLVKMVAGRELTYSVCLGPYVSFLLSAKAKIRGNSRLYLDKNRQIPFAPTGEPVPPVSIHSTTDIRNVTRKINAGIQGGLGVGYPLWGGHLFFDTRFIAGLTNLYDETPPDGKSKTRSVVMTVGYEFSFR